ncbi:MAG TPA: hypothetical protein VMW24_08355 [Sedimentisphaerales bacterium]|nr:hypothetical protein [Sedimentisphaerales bacterium]
MAQESGPVFDLLLRVVSKVIGEELRVDLLKLGEAMARLDRQVSEIRALLERHPGGDQEQSIEQIPSSGTCWTCLWFWGKICLRAGSPNHNKRVAAIDTCELYKHTKIPRGEAIKQVGDPAARRATAVCPNCGHLIPTKKNGVLYQHDLEGHIYRGHGGDKERPCQEDKVST